jgi:hypothetical protein
MQPSRKREGKSVGARGEHCGEAWVRCTVGPARKRQGKSDREGTGCTVGMQPSAKAEGKPEGEGAGGTVGM